MDALTWEFGFGWDVFFLRNANFTSALQRSPPRLHVDSCSVKTCLWASVDNSHRKKVEVGIPDPKNVDNVACHPRGDD